MLLSHNSRAFIVREEMAHNILTQLNSGMLWLLVALLFFFLADLLYVLIRNRRTEAELKESMDQVNLLLHSAAEGIYGLDLDGNCTFCNPACLKLLGYENERELLGKNLHEMIHHTRADGTPYPAEDCQICHAYLYNDEVHLEDEVLWRKDESSFPVEYWSYPMRRRNQPIGAVVSFLDITDRKNAENRLLVANQELDSFVYTVSHDLRTPISAVIGYADIIQETYKDELNDDVLKLLQTIELQGERMSMLVEDLLALATAGNIEPPEQPVDVNETVAFVAGELETEREASGIKLIIDELPDVRIPESLVTQIFDNLVGNALRYAGDNAGPIEIGGERKGNMVRYYVRDHGKGIPEEERHRIFDLFYRGSTGKDRTGSGVGLATVKKICQLYDGRTYIEETPGGGATFVVEVCAI